MFSFNSPRASGNIGDLTPRQDSFHVRTRRGTPRGESRVEAPIHSHQHRRRQAHSQRQPQPFHSPLSGTQSGSAPGSAPQSSLPYQQQPTFSQPPPPPPPQQQQQSQWSWQQASLPANDGVFEFGAGLNPSHGSDSRRGCGSSNSGPVAPTLWSWSKAMWNDPKQWPHIFAGCRSRIGEDPRAMAPQSDLDICTRVPIIGKRKTVTVTTTVKPGDCLWGISRQLTGTGANWKDVVHANSHLFKRARFDSPIDNSLFIIQPGWQLQMPVTAPPPPEN